MDSYLTYMCRCALLDADALMPAAMRVKGVGIGCLSVYDVI